MSSKGIHIESLSKRYGDGDTAVFALRDVNMHVAPGEVVGLIGPSGSGKSTLLRCINLLETPDEGSILYHGDDILSGSVNMPRYHAAQVSGCGDRTDRRSHDAGR